MRILLAEDNPVTHRLIESMLLEWGYEVHGAADGNQAWAIMQGQAPPPVAILDWMMPGLDGVEVCQRIRESKVSDLTYVILLTSMDQKEDIVFGLKAGANDYMVKPFDREELKARVANGRRLIELQLSLAKRVTELQEAFAHIRTLQGIIPICMYCKKIRNDNDAWDKIETYIQSHSDARFSHGLCPECLEEHYPEED